MRILGAHRRRASQAIALNSAEGNGTATSGDRRRSFESARGSALECAAIQDVLAGARSVVRRRQQQAKGTARSSCGHAHDAQTAWLGGQRGAWRISGWSVRYQCRCRYRYRRR
ncbi:MAG: four helix bundle protein [Thiohalocapsa sp. PB-PSB1]|nr:MAG: four helix bundle protein [Thiohalocapsa sp. PB-PSB1]